MSERDGYEPGVPCWVAAVHADPEAAVRFYTELFGWESDTFAMGDAQMTVWHDEAPPPHWAVDFWIGDADAAAAKAAELGGSVVAGPYDVPGFRQAVLADPQGAAFTASQLVTG